MVPPEQSTRHSRHRTFQSDTVVMKHGAEDFHFAMALSLKHEIEVFRDWSTMLINGASGLRKGPGRKEQVCCRVHCAGRSDGDLTRSPPKTTTTQPTSASTGTGQEHQQPNLLLSSDTSTRRLPIRTCMMYIIYHGRESRDKSDDPPQRIRPQTIWYSKCSIFHADERDGGVTAHRSLWIILNV